MKTENITELNEQLTPEQPTAEPVGEPAAEQDATELTAALIEARVKLALLMCGAEREKLPEGAVLAMGLVAAGADPEEAAAKVITEYPHLKLKKREIPVFAAESRGSSDGFAAIKSIFARR